MTPLEKLLNRSDKTEIKKLNKLVDEIDALEEKISSLNKYAGTKVRVYER